MNYSKREWWEGFQKYCTEFPKLALVVDLSRMWAWVGGRSTELSAAGMLPAALQGFDIDSILAGARDSGEATRTKNAKPNPSALLAMAFFDYGNGKVTENMVILPYRDRLELFSKYLQQLFMESIGKELDLGQVIVNQRLTMLGNKGQTCQNSYIKQLRYELSDFFVAFIHVLRDESKPGLEVGPQYQSANPDRLVKKVAGDSPFAPKFSVS